MDEREQRGGSGGEAGIGEKTISFPYRLSRISLLVLEPRSIIASFN